MTWALRIFFSALLLLDCGAANVPASTVRGSVELIASQHPMVRRHKDYSGIVVWLEPVNGRPRPAPRTRPAEMIQKDKTFKPHVLAIPVGSSVSFPNLDPIFHNAFSNFNGQIFDVGLYPPFSSRKITFRREGVVRVFCNFHPSMSAVIIVLRTPYYTVTRADG